eukprot:2902181-Pyramimonas_sp.AAC.1
MFSSVDGTNGKGSVKAGRRLSQLAEQAPCQGQGSTGMCVWFTLSSLTKKESTCRIPLAGRCPQNIKVKLWDHHIPRCARCEGCMFGVLLEVNGGRRRACEGCHAAIHGDLGLNISLTYSAISVSLAGPNE